MSHLLITIEKLEKYFSEDNRDYNFLKGDTYSITELNNIYNWNEKKVNRIIDAIFKGFGISKGRIKKINPNHYTPNYIRRKWIPLFELCVNECMGEESVLYNIGEMDFFADYCFLFLNDYMEDNFDEPELLEWLHSVRSKIVNEKVFE